MQVAIPAHVPKVFDTGIHGLHHEDSAYLAHVPTTFDTGIHSLQPGGL